MRAMTIGRQIGVGFAACLGALLLMAVIATLALHDVAGSKDEVIQRRAPLVAKAHELDATFSTKSTVARGYLLTGDEAHLSRLSELDDDFEALLAQIQRAAGPRLGAELSEVASGDDAWDRTFEQIATERRAAGSADAVAGAAERNLLPAYDRVRAALTTVVAQEEAAIARDVAASDRRKSRDILILWGLAGLTLVTAAALAVWLTRRISRQLSDLAVRVDAAAREILTGVTQQVSGASEQAAAVQQTVATVDELVQTAEQAVERAQSVAGRAQTSVEVAGEGNRAVADTSTGMRQIREQVEDIAQSIMEMAKRAQMIGDVVGTVESIAAETHLLALNAAIEAARAGEHGRGFAVVADEVKNLADQSRAATTKVSRILAEIEQGTGAAVMATEEGTKSTETGTELVAQAGDTIRDLADAIASAAIAAEQIAASSRQQAAATLQISDAMRNVDTVMEQNVTAARQSEQTARDLTAAAHRMKLLVGAQ